MKGALLLLLPEGISRLSPIAGNAAPHVRLRWVEAAAGALGQPRCVASRGCGPGR
eukprot:COSAG01_NODE_1327_length_10710_cov_2074.778155_10_plen_55_part_00